MKILLLIRWAEVSLLLSAIAYPALAAPPCKGPNKNDPGCAEAQLDIPFSADIAAEVIEAGSHNLFVGGAMQRTVFIGFPIVDPAATWTWQQVSR